MAPKPLDRKCPVCRRWLAPDVLAEHERVHAAAAANRARHWRKPADPQPHVNGFMSPHGRPEDRMPTLTDAQRTSLAAIREKERQDEATRRAEAAARFAAYQAQTPAQRAQRQHQLPKPPEEAPR